MLSARSFEKFFIVDHPKEDHNKRLHFRRNPGPSEKVFQSKRSIHISGPQLITIASILELLKILFKVIATSKFDPLKRLEKRAAS